MGKRKPKDIDGFKGWLTRNGAEVLAPTNPYELVRYRAADGVSVVYKRDSGRMTFTGSSKGAWDNYSAGKDVRLAVATNRSTGANSKKRHARDLRITERDGPNCFYCDGPFTDENPRSREHLVSITHGGPNRVENLFHACMRCNLEAGHLSAAEKIRSATGSARRSAREPRATATIP